MYTATRLYVSPSLHPDTVTSSHVYNIQIFDLTNSDQRCTVYEAGHEELRPEEPLPNRRIIEDIFLGKVRLQGTD